MRGREGIRNRWKSLGILVIRIGGKESIKLLQRCGLKATGKDRPGRIEGLINQGEETQRAELVKFRRKSRA
jgi:hypothetical protein